MKLLELLKKYNFTFKILLKIVVLETALRLLLVYFWNWLFSANVNNFLFNEPKVGLFKGFVFISALLYILSAASNFTTNNIYGGTSGTK